MNATFLTPHLPIFDVLLQYWVAVAATIANIIVIVGYISKKELREANLFIILLAAGDMLQGLGLGLNHGDPGPPPGFSALPDNFSLQHCSFSNVKITIAKVGIQLQTLATVTIAAERFLAVKTPLWYYSHYNLKYKYVAIVVLLLVACLSFCIAILSDCSNSLDYWYELLNETFIVRSGYLSVRNDQCKTKERHCSHYVKRSSKSEVYPCCICIFCCLYCVSPFNYSRIELWEHEP
jgi:hypothetical protein